MKEMPKQKTVAVVFGLSFHPSSLILHPSLSWSNSPQSHIFFFVAPRKTDPVETIHRKHTERVELITTPSGLQYEDIVIGTGAEATAGLRVEVHYTGTLTNGDKFDSSKDRNRPFAFKLGVKQVIAGWDEGVAGMKVGGKRKLVIPPDLGYGARGAGDAIPPNATLVFEVELLGVL
jgi:FKBP-type peptidyl-prolyl cis-trans isomerase